jgi:hypothetical protein
VQILVIHLKRFYFARLTGYREKIDTLVDFPVRGLDVSAFCKNPDEVKCVTPLWPAHDAGRSRICAAQGRWGCAV